MEEPDLMPEIAVSSLMKEGVHQFRKKFDFVANIQLEAPEEDECIIKGTARRVVIHEESLNVRLRIPMLLTRAELL